MGDESELVHRHEVREVLLAQLTSTHRAAENASAARLAMITQARRLHATWSQIGAALDMSRQAAHKRFGTVDTTSEEP